MKKQIILFVISLAAATCCWAQDYTFSQFYALPLMRNPALGGIFTGDVNVQAVYRNQWASVTTPFRTGALNAEINTFSHDISIGLLATYDIAGDSKLKRVRGLLSASGHKTVFGGCLLTGAVMGGLVSSNFDVSKLQFDDQYVNGSYSASNPTGQMFSNTSRTYPDLSAGLSILTPEDMEPRAYLGFAAMHVIPYKSYFLNESFDYNRQFMLNGGMKWELTDAVRVSAYADYIFQRQHQQFLVGGYGTFDVKSSNFESEVSFSAGAMLRWNDAIIPVVRLDWYQWNIGLSYDVNISKLATASGARGGFELTLGFVGNIYTDCPTPNRWGKPKPRRNSF